MSTDTKIKTLIFNKLTQEQYNNADRVPTEFYLTPDTSIDSSEKGAANGVASLDTNGKVPSTQIPVATASALGGVKPDGNTITVTEDGTISASISGEGIATKADLQEQASEFQQALNGKADTNLGNTTPSQSFKEMSVGWGMPDYSAGVEIPVASLVSGYTATIDSIFYINGQHPSGITITVDNNYVGVLGGSVSTMPVKVKKGQVIKLSVTPQTANPAVYFPLEGVN